ncbi:MAG: hypothetical protein RIC85_00355 [Gammaproteobacteria bacterium]
MAQDIGAAVVRVFGMVFRSKPNAQFAAIATAEYSFSFANKVCKMARKVSLQRRMLVCG